MIEPRLRAALLCAPLLALGGCPVDERTLDFGLSLGSESGSHGGSSFGDSEGGAGGESSGASAGGAPGDAGRASAGDAPSIGGASGQSGAGVAGSATAGSFSGGGQAGTPTTGGTAGDTAVAGAGGMTGGGGNGGSAGSSGSGGNPDVGACGDINLNGVQDCDETLVQNPSFKEAVTGWATEPSLNQAWQAEDARGAPGSGSIAITNVKAGGNEWGLSATGQCLVASPGQTYELGARAYIPAGQAQGRATINVVAFGNDGCQGTFLASATPALLGEPGAWHIIKGKWKTPPATRSLYVRLGAEKPNSQPSLEVHFDDVLVHRK